MIKDKTVYILGAGFSMDAGAPSQSEIIKEIYALKSSLLPIKNQTKVNKWVDSFDQFLKKSLRVSEKEKMFYTLEDIYTPIDRSIGEGSSFRGYSTNELIELRDNINRLIILAVRNAIEKSGKSRKGVEKFARHVVSTPKIRIG